MTENAVRPHGAKLGANIRAEGSRADLSRVEGRTTGVTVSSSASIRPASIAPIASILGGMSEPASELPAEALARRGVVTHLTINGERVALIVPASLMDTLRILATLLTSGQASAALPALLPEVYPWARYLPDEALQEFAGELGEALRGGDDAPELVERVVISWRSTAEAYADPELLAALRAPVTDCGPVPEPPASSRQHPGGLDALAR